MARTLIIQHPVVDLRTEPLPIPSQDYSHQNLRETQLLFGERVELLEERIEWIKVAALEQLCFSDIWHPYVGWILRSEVREVTHFESPTHVVHTPSFTLGSLMLSYGTLLTKREGLREIPAAPCRTQIVEDARHFIGSPYLWGGRASCLPSSISSVDCSGLINLLYRAQGICLPRNAHEQYLKGIPVTHLQPGDPLYLQRAERVNHVILKLDETTFIEAPETGKCVRLLTWGKEIWENVGKLHFFDRPHPYTMHPRRFID